MRSLLSVVCLLAHDVLVYDVTRRDSFNNLEVWLNEIEMYTTNPDVIKLLVGNKIDKVRGLSIIDVDNNTPIGES